MSINERILTYICWTLLYSCDGECLILMYIHVHVHVHTHTQDQHISPMQYVHVHVPVHAVAGYQPCVSLRLPTLNYMVYMYMYMYM